MQQDESPRTSTTDSDKALMARWREACRRPTRFSGPDDPAYKEHLRLAEQVAPLERRSLREGWLKTGKLLEEEDRRLRRLHKLPEK